MGRITSHATFRKHTTPFAHSSMICISLYVCVFLVLVLKQKCPYTLQSESETAVLFCKRDMVGFQTRSTPCVHSTHLHKTQMNKWEAYCVFQALSQGSYLKSGLLSQKDRQKKKGKRKGSKEICSQMHRPCVCAQGLMMTQAKKPPLSASVQVMEDLLPPSWPQLTRMLILLYIFHLLRRVSSSGCRPALLPPRRRPLHGARQRDVECHAAYVHFSSSQEEDMEFL